MNETHTPVEVHRNMEQKNAPNIWVTNHAIQRFIERILAPNGLLYSSEFATKRDICLFLKMVMKRAVQRSNKAEGGVDRVCFPWPFPTEEIPDTHE